MPQARVSKTIPRTPVPDGTILEAEVLDITEQESRWKNDDGSTKLEWSWKFKVIQEGDFKDRWFWGQTSPFLSDTNKNAKLNVWTRAVMGLDKLPDDFLPDTDEHLVGQRCRIDIGAAEKAEKADGSHLNEDGSRKIVNWVADVYRSQAPQVFADAPQGTIQDFQEKNTPEYETEDPFRIPADEWLPGAWGEFPTRLL